MKRVIITKEEISLSSLRGLRRPKRSFGARLFFEGIVRNNNEGKKVAGIYYEGYADMAKKELKKITDEAEKRWPVDPVVVAHRLGELVVGEVSLVVVVDSPHRAQAFAAIQYIINQLKRRVPVWKKENYEAGQARWVL